MKRLLAIALAAGACDTPSSPVVTTGAVTGTVHALGTARASYRGEPETGQYRVVVLDEEDREEIVVLADSETGRYLFDELRPGAYTVWVDARGTGHTFATPLDGQCDPWAGGCDWSTSRTLAVLAGDRKEVNFRSKCARMADNGPLDRVYEFAYPVGPGRFQIRLSGGSNAQNARAEVYEWIGEPREAGRLLMFAAAGEVSDYHATTVAGLLVRVTAPPSSGESGYVSFRGWLCGE